MTALKRLQEIVTSITRIPLKPGPIGADEHPGIARGKFNFAALELIGLPAEGVQAISKFTELLRKEDTKLERAASSAKIADAIFDVVLELFSDVPGASITAQQLERFKNRLSQWVALHDVKRLHLVPCFVVPRDCGSFTIGPVHFVHASHFEERRAVWESMYSGAPDDAYAMFLNQLKQSGAQYLAEVEVSGRENDRSQELADLTVDLALAGLQLVIPLDESRHFSRMSGRRLPVYRFDIVISKQGVNTPIINQLPGLALGLDQFQSTIKHASKILDSVGGRLDVFLGNRDTKLPFLEQAWCDGAYWMREAFAEPIETIAVAKLETSIEQLLSPANSRLSEARLRGALKAFNGLEPEQPVFSGSSMTAKEFAKKVVEMRSCVLHGTRSTLTEEADELSYAVSILARDHVLKCTLALDRYLADAKAIDTAESFLKWLEDEHAWKWTWM